MQEAQRSYIATNQLNIEKFAPQYNIYQNLDTQRLSYTILECGSGNRKTALQQLAGAIDVKLADLIPFVSPRGFEDWKNGTKLFLHGISGVGKSRCVFEIVKSTIAELNRIYVINPINILKTDQGDMPAKTVANLINEVKSNDAIVWYNFPDGLEDGQNPQRALEALVKLSSSFIRIKRLFFTLNPAYRELYRGIASRTPEIQENEVIYTQEHIKQLLRSYGEDIAEYNGVYQNYVENSIEVIAQILFEREPTPATVSAYFDEAVKESSRGFMNPILLARQFPPPAEFYSSLFRFIKNERHQEAHFLYAVKLCYDLRLPRTRQNVKTIQKKIFDSPIPPVPEMTLSSWIYITSGQYSISDHARNEISYPEDTMEDIVRYFCSDEFLNFIPKDVTSYSAVGTFIGKHLSSLGGDSFGSMLPQNIIDMMSKELSFKTGLIYGITLGFSTFDVGLQEKIWRLSEGDKGIGATLFSGLGKVFHLLSSETQNRLLQKADENSEIETWLVLGLGFSFANLAPEIQENLWNKVKEKAGLAAKLAIGISYSYPTLNRENQEKLWQMAKINMDFAFGLGLSIGSNYAFFDQHIQDALSDQIDENEWEDASSMLGSGFAMGLALNIQSLNSEGQDMVFGELRAGVKTSIFSAMGLGLAFVNSNQSFQDKIWSEVEEDDDTKEMFAIGLGSVFHLFKPHLQEKIWEKAEEDDEFASSLAGGLGNVFQALNPSLQNKIWEKAEGNEDFGGALAVGLGKVFPLHSREFQQKIWEKAEEDDEFASGFATGLGEGSFRFLSREYEEKVWLKAEADTEFGDSFTSLMGPHFPFYSREIQEKILQRIENMELKYSLAGQFGRTFGFLDEINRERMLTAALEDPRMSLIVGVGIGDFFMTYDNNLQKRLLDIVRIDEDQDFFYFFAHGVAIAFNAEPDARQKLSSLASEDSKFRTILGLGVGRNYLRFDSNVRLEILSLARQNDELAFNIGKGAREDFESLDKDIKGELLQLAQERPSFATGLGRI